MSYELIFSPNALEDISFLKKTDKLAYKKLDKLRSFWTLLQKNNTETSIGL